MSRALVAAVVLLGIVLGGSVLDVPTWAQAPDARSVPKIGFIDIQRVLVRSAAGVAAREQLEKDKASMQHEIDAKRQELDRLRDELEKKGSLMSADTRRDKEDTLERRRRDAARLADDFQRELARKERQLLVKVQQQLAGVIERLGKQKGYFMIVERRGAGVLYHAPEADLTDEIIRAYDQEAATKGKK